VDKFAGSIDEGKDADLVIFDKYPLSVYATPEQVFIDGQLYFSRERDRERQKAIEADKKRLSELDAAPQAPKATGRVSQTHPQPVSAGRQVANDR
jgi:adenine deaminase